MDRRDTGRADLPGRVLGLAVRQLPGDRHEWGRAMQAEFLRLEPGPARWGFALGCARVALSRPPTVLRLACLLAVMAAGAVVASQTAGQDLPGAIVLVLLVPVVHWIGRRHGRFGPVGPGLTARTARAGGYVAISACFLLYLRGLHYPTEARPNPLHASAVLLLWAVTSLGVYTVAMLAATAHSSVLDAECLATGIGFGVLAGVLGFVLMPFQRVLPPLAASLPGAGSWLVLLALGAPVAAGVLARWSTGRGAQGGYALLCSVAVAALLVFLFGEASILLSPGRVPDIGSASAGLRLSTNIEEAADPYLAVLQASDLVIAMTGVLLLGASRRGRAQRTPVENPAC